MLTTKCIGQQTLFGNKNVALLSEGWQFLFLGANIDAAEEAEKIGIRRSHAASYKNDAKGVKLNYEAAGSIMACMRSADYDEEDVELMIPQFLRPIKAHLEDED